MKAKHQNTLEPLSVKVKKGNVVECSEGLYALNKICIHTGVCAVFEFIGECPYLCENFEAEEPIVWDDEPSDFAKELAKEVL